MKVYTTIKIGENHTNHCEDYLYHGEIGANKMMCAVMDGCTMANDSYLISTLVGKILRKVAKERSYKEFYGKVTELSLDNYLKSIVHDLFVELRYLKNRLMLDDHEMLTTLLILIYDCKMHEGIALVIGDGVVCVDGIVTEFEQDNKPDYIGYHLAEDFDSWYSKQLQVVKLKKFKDASISTDGIAMFQSIDKRNGSINPINYLLIDKDGADSLNMLNAKVKALENDFGLKPTDDIAIVRIINE
jgi:hypothetical protein